MPFGLDEQILARIRRVLAGHPAVEQAVIYGSRAKGCHKPGSDIDLNLQGPGISPAERDRIILELDDLDLPHTLDVTVLGQLTHEPLREQIQRAGVVLYRRRPERAEPNG